MHGPCACAAGKQLCVPHALPRGLPPARRSHPRPAGKQLPKPARDDLPQDKDQVVERGNIRLTLRRENYANGLNRVIRDWWAG